MDIPITPRLTVSSTTSTTSTTTDTTIGVITRVMDIIRVDIMMITLGKLVQVVLLKVCTDSIWVCSTGCTSRILSWVKPQ